MEIIDRHAPLKIGTHSAYMSTLIPPDAPQCGFILVKTSIENFLQITMVTNIGILIIIDKVRSHSQNQIQAMHGFNMFARIKLT